MAGKTTKATQAGAKGRITNGKPGKSRAGRAGARGKRSFEREAAPAAETAQEARRAAENGFAGDGGFGEDASDPGSRGLDSVTEEVSKLLEQKSRKIAAELANAFMQGKAGNFKTGTGPGNQKTKESEMERQRAEDQQALRDLALQPEYEEAAEEGENEYSPHRGVLATVHAVAESRMEG